MEFMYKIVLDVFPSNQNYGAAPVYSIYCIQDCAPFPKFLYVADFMFRLMVDIFNPVERWQGHDSFSQIESNRDFFKPKGLRKVFHNNPQTIFSPSFIMAKQITRCMVILYLLWVFPVGAHYAKPTRPDFTNLSPR